VSPSARAELAALVNHRPGVVADLEHVVAQHYERQRRPDPLAVPPRDYLRRRRAADQLSRAFLRLASALRDAPEDLIEALAGAAPFLYSGSLRKWEEDLAVLSFELIGLRAIQRGRRGAPINWRRRRLEEATVRVLRRAGVRLTKARDGRLAKILIVIYDAAGELGAEDIFPVLQRLLR
jgi:hypothetical protein